LANSSCENADKNVKMVTKNTIKTGSDRKNEEMKIYKKPLMVLN